MAIAAEDWNRRLDDDGSEFSVEMTCPGCGLAATLRRSWGAEAGRKYAGHKINAAGVVSPSVICAHGCGFHEYVELEAFPPDAGE